VVQRAQKRPGNSERIVAIEAKRSEGWDRSWEKPMCNLTAGGGVRVERMVGVYCGSREYIFGDVTVLSFERFVSPLYDKIIF